jgi:hypothetical protein
MMILTLHNLAKEYKLLPSDALSRATTFDLYVLDVATRYQQYQQDLAQGKTAPKNNYGLTQEQMKAMLASVNNKERKGGNKTN